ncbi:MAG: hypothetical protein SOZ98_05715, partial [Sodaliphilus sp.]|nr:hypothetical protein [Sodaliphilus sp.]
KQNAIKGVWNCLNGLFMPSLYAYNDIMHIPATISMPATYYNEIKGISLSLYNCILSGSSSPSGPAPVFLPMNS